MNKTKETFGFNYWDKGSIPTVLCEDCKKSVQSILDHNKVKLDLELKVYVYDSQPGDMTRYSYFVYRAGYEYFHFMPKNSTFKFPQRLKYWDCKDFDVRPDIRMESNYVMPEELIQMANGHDCNVWTLVECIRTMKELKEGDL